jgi:hypothetical protein
MLSIGLAEPLQKCIGLIQYTYTAANTLIVTSRLVSDVFVESATRETKEPSRGPTTVSNVAKIEDVVTHVQRLSIHLNSNIRKIGQAGYATLKPNMQIYIVGTVKSAAMNNILRIVQEQLYPGDLAKEADVYLLLCPNTLVSSDAITEIRNTIQQMDSLVKFSYKFDDMPAGYISEEASHYAIAQALYALTTTGITSQEAFGQKMQRQLSSNEDQRVGYLITSSITFPRKLLVDCCSIHLGSELMQQWGDDISKGLTLEEKTEQRHCAGQSMGEVEQWMRDSSPRPTKLFTLFSPERVDEEYKQRKKPFVTWMDVVDKIIDKKAQEAYKEWRKEPADLWKERLKKVHTCIEEAIKDISLSNINSSNVIKVYIDECKESLANLLGDWSRQREDKYEEAIKHLKDTLSASGKAINDQDHAPGDQVSSETRDIPELLRQRLVFEQARVASIFALVAAGLLAAPPLILIALGLFPAWPVPLVIEVGVSFILFWSMLFRRWQQRKVVRMRKALLTLYHLYVKYTRDCEDCLHRYIQDSLQTLLSQVAQAEDEHLQKMNAIIAEEGVASQAHIDTALKNLLDSPQATRDTFIDDRGGEQVGAACIKNLAERIAIRQYGGKSKQKYDRSQFLKSFQDRLKQITKTKEHEAPQHVLKIVRPVVDTYLSRRSLAKTTHLDDQIWEDAFSRVHSPLSRSPLGSPVLLFICGGNQALLENGKTYVEKRMQKKPVMVYTDNSECLLLAGFFQSGSAMSGK